MKNGKSPGIDNILVEMIKASEHIIIHFLEVLLNKIFNSRYFPEIWTKAIIVPLHKKGHINDPDNYRGISLLSSLGKIYTYVLNERITKWANVMEKISENQAGFRQGYSVIDHIFTLSAIIEKTLCKKKRKLYVAFIDFKKAFDFVERNKLWSLLSSYGLNGKMLQALMGIYKTVQSCVRSRSGNTDFFECPFGLRQGCMLSPVLFSLFINELSVEVSKNGKHGVQLFPDIYEILMLLFADDVILVSDSIVGLQCQLNTLSSYAYKWGLTVNLDKSKVVVFRKGGILSINEKWIYDGNKLQVVDSYKYLGLVFNSTFNFKKSVVDLSLRSKKAFMEFATNLQKLGSVKLEVFFKIFDSQIQPIYLYGSEIWGFRRYDSIEKIHLMACKLFLNVGPQTPNAVVYGECGRHPVYINSYIRTIRYWLKLTVMPEERIPRKAYNMLLLLDNLGYKTWATEVRLLLNSHGFGYVWLSQFVYDHDSFINIFKQRLIDMFTQNWICTLEGSSRYTLYREYKYTFGAEKYLSQQIPFKFRKVLIKFRAGLLNLNINEGRWKNIVLPERICPLCNSDIENEFHFLYICPFDTHIRKKYFPTNMQTCVCMTLFTKFMQTEVISVTNLSYYLYHAFEERKRRLDERDKK